jgi:hypothetical protein
VTARLRYILLCATRTRATLIPMAGSIFAILGVFAYRGNEVGSTWGLTAVLSAALAAWLVSAALVAEPAAQADMATVAAGGRPGRARLELTQIAIAAAALTVGFIAFPLVTSPLGSTPMFVPRPLPVDVLVAVLAHLCCAALGGAIGALCSPPRLKRPATVAASAFALLLALVPIGAFAGPVALARAMTDARRGTVTAAEVLAALSCLVLAALAHAAATRWARSSG